MMYSVDYRLDLVENLQRKKRIPNRIQGDTIPVQAFAVPCEPVFLSNKETHADRRSNTSGSLTEVLQILKHLGRSRS